MPTIQRQLAIAVDHLAVRRIPTSWTRAEPALAQRRGIPDIVAVIRESSSRSDEVLAALVRLASDDQDAAVIALHALVPAITRCVGVLTKAQFRSEILVDLAAVILDPGELDGVRYLPERLVKRAHQRVRRRIETENRFRSHRLLLEDAVDLPCPMGMVEDVVVDRVHVGEVGRMAFAAIEAGDLSARTWIAYCDGKLWPALTGGRRPVDRRATFAAVRTVKHQLVHAD